MYSFDVKLSQFFLYSAMLVEDPFKGKPDIDALFERVRELSSLEEPNEPLDASSSKNFPGSGKRISGESVSSPPQKPENIVHDLVFWKNGFTVGGGPLRRYEDPENAQFLEVCEFMTYKYQGIYIY